MYTIFLFSEVMPDAVLKSLSGSNYLAHRQLASNLTILCVALKSFKMVYKAKDKTNVFIKSCTLLDRQIIAP